MCACVCAMLCDRPTVHTYLCTRKTYLITTLVDHLKYSVLQRDAVCRSVNGLRVCVTVCYSVLQCVAVCCSLSQCVV